MQRRVNVVGKVIFIVFLILLSLIPFYLMQQYVQSILEGQNTLTNLTSKSLDYISGLAKSLQSQSLGQEPLNINKNYLLCSNSIKSAPITLALGLLLLLLLDTIKSTQLSLTNYIVVTIGLILFYLVEIVLANYVRFEFAYLFPAIVLSLLLLIYLSGSMKSIITSILYSIGLLAIYALSFYLIGYVDNILMYGVIGLVVIFIAIIGMTRKN
ncbi:inner membrane CreD family protein [Orbus wheelerorum]|uniref:inner membrane CreD family protein n=1 Tax=Orbus wheelerorum TaxID=3074111 RepID=UPI00370D1CC1